MKKLFIPALKKFNFYLILGLSMLLLFVNSCKKDRNQIAQKSMVDAKSWFESEIRNTGISLIADNGEKINLIPNINWKKTMPFDLENGDLFYSIPIESNMPINSKAPQLSLFICKNESGYHYKILPKIEGGLDISHAYNYIFANNAHHNSPTIKNTTMGGAHQDPITPPPLCTEYYLVITTFYSDGSSEVTSSTLLYTICEGENGGGGDASNSNAIITQDTSVTNNAKINCLLKKLLGSDGTAGNEQMKELLTAFVGKGFNVTFKIGTTQTNSKGETSADPYDPTKYNIVLNRTKINTESQMSWVKTLLHEAFHANLMQKAYEMFGDNAIGLWAIGPKDLTLEELMDKIENVTQSNPTLAQQHHEFMAMNIGFIKDGLKSFSAANNTNHNDFNDDHFTALAYEGLNTTLYYLNNVIKDGSGNDRMGTYKGNVVTLTQAFYYNSKDFQTQSIVPCN